MAQAVAVKEKYGFADFKLKGGVLESKEELKAICSLKETFPDARITLDPNGSWLLRMRFSFCSGMGNVLAYCEDPCGSEKAILDEKLWLNSGGPPEFVLPRI